MPNSTCDRTLNILHHKLSSVIVELILHLLSQGSRLMPKTMRLPMKSLPLLVEPEEEVKSSPESGETHTLTHTSC